MPSAQQTFQYMLLLRGATRSAGRADLLLGCFNTCSSCEEQRKEAVAISTTIAVSIHAPLARSNKLNVRFCLFRKGFNTCSSCEEQLSPLRQLGLYHVSIHAPLARSNKNDVETIQKMKVSIHAPLARSNERFGEVHAGYGVSIHAPLARSNWACLREQTRVTLFQYMLLLRGATSGRWRIEDGFQFQYMLLLRGATGMPSGKTDEDVKFQYMLLLRGATVP